MQNENGLAPSSKQNNEAEGMPYQIQNTNIEPIIKKVSPLATGFSRDSSIFLYAFWISSLSTPWVAQVALKYVAALAQIFGVTSFFFYSF